LLKTTRRLMEKNMLFQTFREFMFLKNPVKAIYPKRSFLNQKNLYTSFLLYEHGHI